MKQSIENKNRKNEKGEKRTETTKIIRFKVLKCPLTYKGAVSISCFVFLVKEVALVIKLINLKSTVYVIERLRMSQTDSLFFSNSSIPFYSKAKFFVYDGEATKK